MTRPSPKELQRLAVASAKEHVAAAKLLADNGHPNLATFHILAAIEEIQKSKMVGDEVPDILEVLEGQSVAEEKLRRGALKHDVKLPTGLLTMLLESPFLRVASHPDLGRGISDEEMAKLKDQGTADLEWIVDSIVPTEGLDAIRERAIYSGLDHSGRMPPPFDWKGAVRHLLPLVEAETEFSDYVVEQKFTPEEMESVRAQAFELMKNVKPNDGRA
jgi:AbiV family abortive infection protein